ncbi:MAG: DNA gyrase inhibitor YacG [Planctomycetota bacterium]|nr:DNA gyrase inhibitor YacG [Planctomycetota bacterium]MEC8337986.1 DNA gyrase inhibitor YacG [Planctomycetota bacterium]
MSSLVCPICESSFEATLSSSMPFCSERCRKIDLGRWFEEDYSLPIELDPEALDGPDQA